MNLSGRRRYPVRLGHLGWRHFRLSRFRERKDANRGIAVMS